MTAQTTPESPDARTKTIPQIRDAVAEYVPDSAEYVGVDLSPEMLATMERRHPDLDRGGV